MHGVAVLVRCRFEAGVSVVGFPSTKQLECLVAVADTCSFRIAAERLNMSQPPLSRHIKALEDLVGAQLFERNTHSVVLTSAGYLLADKARRILAEMSDGLEEARSLGVRSADRLNVGLTRVIHPGVFPNFERELADRGLQIVVAELHGASRQLVDAVRTGRLDFAVVAAQPIVPRRLNVMDLFEENLVAFLSSSFSIRSGRLTFSDLPPAPLFWFRRLENPILYDAAEQVFANHEYAPSIKPKPAHRDALYVKVGTGDGLAFLPVSQSAIQRNDVVHRRFVKEIERLLRLQIQVVYRRDDTRATLHEALTVLAKASEHHREFIERALENLK